MKHKSVSNLPFNFLSVFRDSTEVMDGYVSGSSDDDSTVSVDYPVLASSVPEPTVVAQTSDGKKWNKTHSCIFCKQSIVKVARHMSRHHQEESEVCQILSLPVGSKERRLAWGKLLKDGDYAHNFQVLKQKRGTVIPKYRQNTSNTGNLIPCPNCKGMYSRKYLYQHHKRCKHQGEKTRQRGVSKKGSLLLPSPSNVAGSFWRAVVLCMNVDNISKACKNDSLILKYGERIFLKRDFEEHTAVNVSSRMRELGRLLLVVKDKSMGQISTLKDALCVNNFDLLLSSVRMLANYNEETHQFGKGSLALRLGYSVKKCAMIKQMEAKKVNDRKDDQDAENFLQVFQGDWCDNISSMAHQSLRRKLFNEEQLLPECEDVQKLYGFVRDHTASDYATLAQVTLCEISLFNRKRGGEVQRMTVDNLKKGLLSDQPQADVQQSLTEVEKALAKKLKRVEIRGKFNRKVPILLTKSMLKKIDRILELREDMTIESPYLFSRANGDKPYRGSDVIKRFATEAQVSNLQLFTFTKLRKQVATMSQALEITENDQDMLAAFLGHDIRVHREYYRLPSAVLQKAKVAQVLMRINEGTEDPKGESTERCDDIENTEESPSASVDNDSNTAKSGPSAPPDMPVTYASAQDMPMHKTKVVVKKPWSKEEEAAVLRHFGHYVTMGKVPQKLEIQKVLDMESSLERRSWKNVKDFVYNRIKKVHKN